MCLNVNFIPVMNYFPQDIPDPLERLHHVALSHDSCLMFPCPSFPHPIYPENLVTSEESWIFGCIFWILNFSWHKLYSQDLPHPVLPHGPEALPPGHTGLRTTDGFLWVRGGRIGRRKRICFSFKNNYLLVLNFLSIFSLFRVPEISKYQ